MIKEHILSFYPREETKSPRTKSLSPSRIIGCPRGAFFDSLGFAQKRTLKGDINLGYGSARHDTLQDVLVEQGVLIPNPNPVGGRHVAEYFLKMKDPPISGYCDGVFADGTRIVDFKTIGKKKAEIKKPKPEHVDQITLYLEMGRECGFPLEAGWLVYEAKFDSSDDPYVEFEVPYDDARVEKLKKKARQLLDDLRDGYIPPPLPGCWCNYRACKSRELHRREGLR